MYSVRATAWAIADWVVVQLIAGGSGVPASEVAKGMIDSVVDKIINQKKLMSLVSGWILDPRGPRNHAAERPFTISCARGNGTVQLPLGDG